MAFWLDSNIPYIYTIILMYLLAVIDSLYSLSPAARACSLAHIAHSIFPIVTSPSGGRWKSQQLKSYDSDYEEENVF